MFSFNKSLSPGSYSTLADLLAGVEILVYALGIHMFSPPASTLYLIARVLDVMWWRELRHTSARTRKALTSLYSTCSSLLGKMNLIPGLYAGMNLLWCLSKCETEQVPGVRILLSSHRLKSSPILSLLRRICGFLVSFLIVGFGAFAGCASHLVSIARGINRRLLLPEPKDGIDIVDDSTDMNTLLNIKPTTGLYGTNTDEGYESELLVYLMDEAVKGCLHIPDNNSSGGNVLVVKYRTVAYLVGAVETPIHTESTHFPENASCEGKTLVRIYHHRC